MTPAAPPQQLLPLAPSGAPPGEGAPRGAPPAGAPFASALNAEQARTAIAEGHQREARREQHEAELARQGDTAPVSQPPTGHTTAGQPAASQSAAAQPTAGQPADGASSTASASPTGRLAADRAAARSAAAGAGTSQATTAGASSAPLYGHTPAGDGAGNDPRDPHLGAMLGRTATANERPSVEPGGSSDGPESLTEVEPLGAGRQSRAGGAHNQPGRAGAANSAADETPLVSNELGDNPLSSGQHIPLSRLSAAADGASASGTTTSPTAATAGARASAGVATGGARTGAGAPADGGGAALAATDDAGAGSTPDGWRLASTEASTPPSTLAVEAQSAADPALHAGAGPTSADGLGYGSATQHPRSGVQPSSSTAGAATSSSLTAHNPRAAADAAPAAATGTPATGAEAGLAATGGVASTSAAGDHPQAAALEGGVGLQQALEELDGTIQLAARQGLAQARIALEPAELGEIRIHLVQTAEGLLARVTAGTSAVAQALAGAHGELRQSLTALGLNLSLELGHHEQAAAHGGATAEHGRDGAAGHGGAAARGKSDRNSSHVAGSATDEAPGDTPTEPQAGDSTPGEHNGALVDVLA